MLNFGISNVTVSGSGRSEVDLNGVVGATITNLTANGLNTAGVGLAITDSANVAITNLASCAGTALNSDGDVTTGACATKQEPSMGGFSDVERDIFQDLLPTVGNVKSADIKVSVSKAGQVFGLATSESLYRALQVAQGLPAGCQDDGAFTAPVVVGLDDKSAACQPSISTTEYSSIINGTKGALPKVVGWGFMAPALANTTIVGGSATVSLTCPPPRDVQEGGGLLALYVAPELEEDALSAVTCVVMP